MATPATAPEHMTDAGERSHTPRLPAAERRLQLMDVAMTVFAEKGFHGASMNEVAETAGVTKPVLYQHFTSKEALYRELVDDLGSRLERAIVDAVSLADGPRQQVEAGFRAYFRWATSEGPAFQVLFAEHTRSDPQLAAPLSKVESLVADRVASLIEIEGLTDAERRILAFGVVGLAESISRHWLLMGMGSGTDADAFADQVAQLAWSGLRGIKR